MHVLKIVSSRSLICSSCLLILLGGRYFSVVFLKFLFVCLIFLVAAIFRSFSQSSWLPLFSVVFIIFLVALTFPKICLLVCPCFLLGLSWLPGWSYGFSFRVCEVQDRHCLCLVFVFICLVAWFGAFRFSFVLSGVSPLLSVWSPPGIGYVSF